jgi:hypothetical protein
MNTYQLGNPRWLIDHYKTCANKCLYKYYNPTRAAYWIYALLGYRELAPKDYIMIIDTEMKELISELFRLLDKDAKKRNSYFISCLRGVKNA